MAPAPRALRFRSGGNLREGDFYVERAPDRELYEALLAGEYCHLLAPRQIGKSSLRVRAERRLREQGVRCAAVDLTAISDGVGGGGTPEQWYATLVDKIAERLKLDEDRVKAGWHKTQGTLTHRWIHFLHDQVLAAEPSSVVIFLDEIDYIQRAPFCADFFASIRALYNLRAEEAAYQRLTFCLVGVAAPADLIEDAVRTPFNIGQGIRLQDFSRAEASALLPGLSGGRGDAQLLLSAILDWTAGHPYMTQRLCETLSARRGRADAAEADALSEPERVAQAVKELFLHRREEDLNLTAAEKRLEQSPKRSQLLRLYRRLLESEQVAAHKDDPVQLELRLTGMAAERQDSQGGRWLQVRNRIFATVFDRDWIERKEPNPLLTQVLPLWLKSGKKEEYLLRGQLLKEAQAWAQGRPDLSADERDFLMAGLQVDQREEQSAALAKERQARAEELDHERRKRIRGLSIVVALLVLALFGSFFEYLRVRKAKQETKEQLDKTIIAETRAEQERQKAEDEKRTAQREKQEADEARSREAAAKQQAEVARQLAVAAKEQALKKQREAEEAQKVAVAALQREAEAKGQALEKQREAVKAKDAAEQAKRVAEQAMVAAEQSAQAELAAKALVLTRQPGQEFDALVAAIKSAGKALKDRTTLPLQELLQAEPSDSFRGAAGALISAVTAMSYAVPQSIILRANHERVRAARFSRDGQQVITTHQDELEIAWDATSGQRLDTASPSGHSTAGGPPPDHRTQVVDGMVHVFDARGKERNALGDNVERAVLSPSGLRLATTSKITPTVQLWDVDSGEPLSALDGHQSKVLSLQFSADEKHLLTASKDGTARIWSVNGSAPAVVFRGHLGAVNSAVYSPDGRRVLTASDDGTARIWQDDGAATSPGGSMAAAAPSPLLVGVMTLSHKSAVNGVAFSPDGSRLLTIGWDNRGTLWDRSGARIAELLGHKDIINSAQFSRDGRYVVTASQDGSARLWELPAGQETQDLAAGQHAAINTAEISSDGKYVVTADKDGAVRLFESATGRPLRLFQSDGQPQSYCTGSGAQSTTAPTSAPSRYGPLSHAASVTAARISPDGRLVLSGARDCAAKLWDVASGKAKAAPIKLDGAVNSVAFAPDGSLAAIAGGSGMVRLQDTSGQHPDLSSASGPRHAAAVNLVLFSHDGKLLLSAASDGTAKLWELAAQKERTVLQGHTGEIFAAAFARDDKLLATASQDGTARIWDTQTGKGLAALRGARGSVYAADFAPDGRTLVTASMDQTARLYSTDVVDYLKLGCQLLRYQPEYPQVQSFCQPEAVQSHAP